MNVWHVKLCSGLGGDNVLNESGFVIVVKFPQGLGDDTVVCPLVFAAGFDVVESWHDGYGADGGFGSEVDGDGHAVNAHGALAYPGFGFVWGEHCGRVRVVVGAGGFDVYWCEVAGDVCGGLVIVFGLFFLLGGLGLLWCGFFFLAATGYCDKAEDYE